MDSLESSLDDYALAEYGDFLVTNRAHRDASERHRQRSRTARRVDSARRAPVTTNVNIWSSDPSHWDYPGIDTPRESPMLLPKDLMTSAYRRSSINVKTTPTRGGESPVDPLGKAEVAGIQDRAFAIERGISIGTSMADRLDDTREEERRQRRREMREKEEHTVPEAVREAEREARQRHAPLENDALSAPYRGGKRIFTRRG